MQRTSYPPGLWLLPSALQRSPYFPTELICEELYRENFGTSIEEGESQGKCEFSTGGSGGPLMPLTGTGPGQTGWEQARLEFIAPSQRRKRA